MLRSSSTRPSTRLSMTSRSLSSGGFVPFSACFAMIARSASSTGGGRSLKLPVVCVMMLASCARRAASSCWADLGVAPNHRSSTASTASSWGVKRCENPLMHRSRRRAHLDTVVLVQHTVDKPPADVDALLLIVDDAVEHFEKLDNPSPHAETRVRDALAELREVLPREVGAADDVLADQLDRRVADGGRAVEHAVLDRAADVVLVEKVGVLRDDETDRTKSLGTERDLRRLGGIDDAVEQRLIHAGQCRRAPEVECEAVDLRLRVLGAASDACVSERWCIARRSSRSPRSKDVLHRLVVPDLLDKNAQALDKRLTLVVLTRVLGHGVLASLEEVVGVIGAHEGEGALEEKSSQSCTARRRLAADSPRSDQSTSPSSQDARAPPSQRQTLSRVRRHLARIRAAANGQPKVRTKWEKSAHISQARQVARRGGEILANARGDVAEMLKSNALERVVLVRALRIGEGGHLCGWESASVRREKCNSCTIERHRTVRRTSAPGHSGSRSVASRSATRWSRTARYSVSAAAPVVLPAFAELWV